MKASAASRRSQKQGTSNPADRRSHKRHQVQSLGVTVLCGGSDVPADLADISLGGMAVNYITAGNGWPDATVCDLVAAGAESALPRALACHTVYDIAELTEGRSFRGSATRRRGLRFSMLRKDQKRELQLFISRSGGSP